MTSRPTDTGSEFYSLPVDNFDQLSERQFTFIPLPFFGMCEIIFLHHAPCNEITLISVYAASRRQYLYHCQCPDFAINAIRLLVCHMMENQHQLGNTLIHQLLELGLVNAATVTHIAQQWAEKSQRLNHGE